MFKKLATLLAGAALIAITSGNAFATYIGANASEASLQTILNEITVAPNVKQSSVDASGAVNDALVYDQYWSITGSGQSAVTFIIELAGYANVTSFGIFNGDDMAQVFSGADTNGKRSVVSILDTGEVEVGYSKTGIYFDSNSFGYYITRTDDSGNEVTWYSDSSKNSDAADHMVAFQGTGDEIKLGNLSPGIWTDNEFVLAFEDTAGLGDQDYNDLVVMVESVAPVPEPGTMVLLGAGMLGLAIFGKRRMNREA